MDELIFKQGKQDIYDVKVAINNKIGFAFTHCINIIQDRRSDNIERQLRKLKEQLASVNDFSLSSFMLDIALSFASAGISQIAKIGIMRLISKAAPDINFISHAKVTDFKYSHDMQFKHDPFRLGQTRDFDIQLKWSSKITKTTGEVVTFQNVIENAKSGFLSLSSDEKEWLLDSMISTLDQAVKQLATQLDSSGTVKISSNEIAGEYIGEGKLYIQKLIDEIEAIFRLIIEIIEILKQNNLDTFALGIMQMFHFFKWSGESTGSYIQMLGEYYENKISTFYSDIFLMGKTIYTCEYSTHISPYKPTGQSEIIGIWFSPTNNLDLRMLLYRYGTFVYNSDAEDTAHKIWEILNTKEIGDFLIQEDLSGIFVEIQENPEISIEFLYDRLEAVAIVNLAALSESDLTKELAQQATVKSRFITYIKENFSNSISWVKIKSFTVHVHCVAIRRDQSSPLLFAIERENVFKMDDGSLYRTPVSFIPLKEVDDDPEFISLAQELTYQNYKSRRGELFREGKKISAEQIRSSFFVVPENKTIDTVFVKKIKRFR